eukprot:6970506-Prymnesium_polylepis.1
MQLALRGRCAVPTQTARMMMPALRRGRSAVPPRQSEGGARCHPARQPTQPARRRRSVIPATNRLCTASSHQQTAHRTPRPR